MLSQVRPSSQQHYRLFGHSCNTRRSSTLTSDTRSRLFFRFCQTCSFLNGASVEWIDDQKVPYAVKGDQWVGFDNDRSIDAKVRCHDMGHFYAWTGPTSLSFVLCEWLTGGLSGEEAARRGGCVDPGHGWLLWAVLWSWQFPTDITFETKTQSRWRLSMFFPFSDLAFENSNCRILK